MVAAMDRLSDEELYRLWAEGDRRAGGDLVDRHVPGISRFLANKVWRMDDVEDLIGRTFELCARELGRFRGDGTFRAYLFGIAHNVLRRYLRDREAPADAWGELESQVFDGGPSPSAVIGHRHEQRLLLRALRALPLDLQLVLELGFFEELSRSEIARVLGIPEGTVASRLRRAQEELGAAIAGLADSPALAESTLNGIGAWARRLRDQLDVGGRRRLAGLKR